MKYRNCLTDTNQSINLNKIIKLPLEIMVNHKL